MEYLKIWTSFREVLALLGDAERGRIITAMLDYAADGSEPKLSGNERFVWPSVKNSIDLQRQKSQVNTENGKLGGRPKKKPNETEQNRTKANESEKNRTKANETHKDNPIQSNTIQDKKGEEKTEVTTPPHGGVQRGARFTPPSVEDVRAYCSERQNGINPEEFVAFYEQKGWNVGKNQRMTDWRASVRYWETQRKKAEKPTEKPSKWGNLGQMV